MSIDWKDAGTGGMLVASEQSECYIDQAHIISARVAERTHKDWNQ